MKRAQPVHTACGTASREQTLYFFNRRLKAGLCLALLLTGATACAGASGPGIGIKVGAQTLTDPVDLDQTTRARLDLEISSPLLLDEHLDFALTVGGLSLGSFEDYYSDVVDGTLLEEFYSDDLSVFDVRLAARFYPLGDHSEIRPYLGTGIGYFWLLDYWDYEYAETFEDPLFPGVYHTFVDEEEGLDSIASGFFPFVLAGLTVPLGRHGELLFEFQYDFAKEDAGFDVGGPIYLLGARLRF